MIDHPLFNFEDETNTDRRKRNICYINIAQLAQGKKPVTLTNQWEPEQLLTPMDLFEAVGCVEGTYELIGRGQKHQILDRQTINVKAPIGWVPPPNRQPPAPPANPQPNATPAAPPVAMMQAGGIMIPANMDPMVAMVISLIASQGQQANAQLARQDAQAQFAQSQQMQLMLGMSQNTTAMMTGLFTGLAPILSGHGNGAAPGGTQDGFLKGVEIMAALKEGIDQAKSGGNTDWSVVSTNIAQSIKGLVEVARTTAGTTPPAPPHVPPGAPPA